MKRYIAFIVAILILFAVGCSNPQTSGGGTPDMQTPSAPPTAQASPSAPPSAAPSPTPDADAAYSRHDIEFGDGDYASLGRLMEKCGFGLMDTDEKGNTFYNFEADPGALTWPLGRARAQNAPVESALVQICAIKPSDRSGLPGYDGRGMGPVSILEVRRVEENPNYTDDGDEPYYIVNEKTEEFVFGDFLLLFLNGYGITNHSYPVVSDGMESRLEMYIKEDLDKVIEGVKAAGEPWWMYYMDYCNDEVVCLSQHSKGSGPSYMNYDIKNWKLK